MHPPNQISGYATGYTHQTIGTQTFNRDLGSNSDFDGIKNNQFSKVYIEFFSEHFK